MLQHDAQTELFTRVERLGVYSVWWRLALSAFVAIPFIAAGGYTLTLSDFPLWAASVVFVVGVALTLLGFYVTVMVRFPQPTLMQGKETLVARHPTMKPAYARMVAGAVPVAAAAVLFLLTDVPYGYPFAAFIVGMYVFFKGVIRYWMNHHTAYYVTNRHLYQFAWINTTEIPVSRIISISEARSFLEMLTGRGSVIVGSGFGARHNIRMDDMEDPGPVAEALRRMMP